MRVASPLMHLMVARMALTWRIVVCDSAALGDAGGWSFTEIRGLQDQLVRSTLTSPDFVGVTN